MLNPAQQQAVAAPGHCLITACPGSGKTTVLAHRAAHLLRTTRSANLAAVTFTSDAAADLKDRIFKQVPNAARRVQAGTFHRMAKLQLLASGRRVRLASAAQQNDLIRRAFSNELGRESESSLDDALAYIERVKSNDEPPRPSSREEDLHAVYSAYQAALRQLGLMDFADLLLDSVQGMADGSVRPLSVDFLLVDEFQDTDPVQIAWVLAHAARGTFVTVVGDDDQSIYGWRSALGYAGMQRFLSATRASHVSLDLTYRCGTEILSSAGKLIGCNADRVPKDLQSASNERGVIRVQRVPSREVEAEQIVQSLQAHPGGTWAILGRTNALLDGIDSALTIAGIAKQRLGGKSFWEGKAPALYLDLLSSIAQRSMSGIDRVLAAAGVGSGAIASLHAKNESHREHALDRFLRVAGRGTEEDKRVVSDLREHVRQWSSLFDRGTFGPALFGVADWISCNTRLGHKASILASCAQSLSKAHGSLSQRVNLAQRSTTEGPVGGVTVMTMHASKGLEFDRVWIAGCEDGLVPHHSSPLEEERRLLYVGMTRARRELILSVATDDEAAPSQFLAEAGLI